MIYLLIKLNFYLQSKIFLKVNQDSIYLLQFNQYGECFLLFLHFYF